MGKEGGEAAPPATAEVLFELLRAWREGSPATSAATAARVASLSLHFNKAAPLPAVPEAAAGAPGGDLKLRVALTPLREDAFLGAAAGCSSAAALEAVINAA